MSSEPITRKRCPHCARFIHIAHFQYLVLGEGGAFVTKLRAACWDCVRPVDDDIYYNPRGWEESA